MDYKIKVNTIQKEDSNIKGFASVVFSKSFKVTNIVILEGNNGLYVQIPRYHKVSLMKKEGLFTEIFVIQ